MNPIVPGRATHVMARHQPEYQALPVRVETVDVDGEEVPCMTTLWQPSPEDLEVLNAGGRVRLQVLGERPHPPVRVEAVLPRED